MLITNKGLDDHVVMILQPDERSPRAWLPLGSPAKHLAKNRPVTRAASSRALSEMPVLTEPRSKATSRTRDFEDCRSRASGLAAAGRQGRRGRQGRQGRGDARDVRDVGDVRDVVEILGRL